MNLGRGWIAVVIVVGLVAGVLITFVWVSPLRAFVLAPVSGMLLHPPSDRDQFFNLVATDFKQPALCDRISSRADASTGGWGAPYEIHRLRSTCRENLNRPPNTMDMETPDSMPRFAAQVRALGYTDADVTQAAYDENPEATPLYAIYEQLLATDEFRSRVRAARSYGEPRDSGRLRSATPSEFMYQMVAVDAPEPDLCSKVSPNATFVDLGGAVALLQSRCYLHIALNTRDLRLCEPLPAARSFPHINEIYDSRERCREAVAIYSKRDSTSTGTYGSAVFPRASDFHRILREIGYDAAQLPPVPEPAADEYWEFVSRMIFRGSDGDRAEFVRRVAAIE